MEERKKHFRNPFHTVSGKNACVMLACSLGMLVFTMFLPQLFYHLTKEDLTGQIGNSIQECSVRIGFLLTNHRTIGQLAESTEFQNLIENYEQEPEGSDARARLYNEIVKKIPIYEEGKKEWDKGSIGSTNYYFALTDGGDLFCPQETYPLAQAVISTDWFRKQDVSAQSWSFQYSPVLSIDIESSDRGSSEEADETGSEGSTRHTEQYLCCTRGFSAGDTSVILVHAALFSDYMDQMKQMDSAGIENYMLIHGKEVFYQSQPDVFSRDQDISQYKTSDRQYEVVKNETGQGYDFTVLCSVNLEELYLVVRMSRQQILAPFMSFFRTLQMVVILMILVMTVLSSGVVFFSLRRLSALGRQMALIGKGATTITLTDDHDDEVGDIVRATRKMLSQLEKNSHEQIRHEKEEKHMQYTMMISAMDPHFIYNTLDTVSFLAAMGRNEDVVRVNDALIATLKDRLRMKAYKTFDTVRTEIEVIRNYMVIQSYLVSDKITCEYEVDPEVDQELIPKNILQPLVENAIKHGLMTNKDDTGLQIMEGKVTVAIHRSGEQLEISVSDNGSGMTEELREHYMKETFDKNGSAEHIGLLNMKGRLAYLYHDHYSFNIESTPGRGTRIMIVVPVVKPEKAAG